MSILKYIEDSKDGNAWEELCVKCYRIRYQDSHYTPISASQGGDGGIEGFTQCGVVHQCYCPEKNYSDDENYEHLRDKLTRDIGKLLKNEYIKKLSEWGVPTIKEWHFVIPEQSDSRIVRHAETKRKEISSAIMLGSTYTHVSADFKVIIKSADDFTEEIGKIILSPYKDYLLNLTTSREAIVIDYTKCESEKVDNIKRKIKAIKNMSDDTDEDVVFMVNFYISSYLKGLEILNDLRLNLPDIYKGLVELAKSCKQDMEIKTRTITDRLENASIFNKLVDEFEEKLIAQFSTSIDLASIGYLKQDLIASWLADCSMEFR